VEKHDGITRNGEPYTNRTRMRNEGAIVYSYPISRVQRTEQLDFTDRKEMGWDRGFYHDWTESTGQSMTFRS